MKALLQASAMQHEANRVVQQQLTVMQEQVKTLLEERAVPRAPILQKMTDHDDVEAFLLTFERTATRENWPQARWAGILAPLLIGDAQKAYSDLEPDTAADYSQLKKEILARAGVTVAVRAQRFHDWQFQKDKVPRSQMFDLIHLTRKWLQPEINSSARIVELLVMDRYLRALPFYLRKTVGQTNPADANELISLVERHTAADRLARIFPEGQPNLKQRTPFLKNWNSTDTGKTVFGKRGDEEQPRAVKGPWGRQYIGQDNPDIMCFACHKRGHIARQCRKNMEVENMECDWAGAYGGCDEYTCSYVTTVNNLFTSRILEGDYLSPIKVAGRETVALLDSGCGQSLITASLIEHLMLPDCNEVRINCIHGDIKTYPAKLVEVEIGGEPVRYKFWSVSSSTLPSGSR